MKQYKVWLAGDEEKRILWLTDSMVAEFRRNGYYVEAI